MRVFRQDRLQAQIRAQYARQQQIYAEAAAALATTLTHEGATSPGLAPPQGGSWILGEVGAAAAPPRALAGLGNRPSPTFPTFAAHPFPSTDIYPSLGAPSEAPPELHTPQCDIAPVPAGDTGAVDIVPVPGPVPVMAADAAAAEASLSEGFLTGCVDVDGEEEVKSGGDLLDSVLYGNDDDDVDDEGDTPQGSPGRVPLNGAVVGRDVLEEVAEIQRLIEEALRGGAGVLWSAAAPEAESGGGETEAL